MGVTMAWYHGMGCKFDKRHHEPFTPGYRYVHSVCDLSLPQIARANKQLVYSSLFNTISLAGVNGLKPKTGTTGITRNVPF